jgi:hypothetical protein
LTKSLTPEERLRRYKEYLSGLQAVANDGRPLSSGTESNTRNTSSKAPVKRELVDALSVLARKKEETENDNAKTNVMLKVKERAIQSSIKEVREERMRLRRKLDRGQITDEEYEREIQKLVAKGKKLLAEQAATNGINGKP